ncbi:MAG: NAD-dependent epimerase/dehydratase family protein [Candidatus Aenigmarchaeota archaeon]|nr:NAD-dependent epimerase/dehydratase family protein [Candidatus Aenigmarchaeota archaeon]
MKILVTGGAGFVGSYITDKLIDLGNDVVILDNLSNGNNLSPKAELVSGDICKTEDCIKAVSGCETVFHLAAQVSVQKSTENPAEDSRINVLGTINMLEAAKKAGAKNFIYFSSAAVYGNPKKVPISETDPTVPISPYGASKLAAEGYCRLYENMTVTIVRPFNIYGPRQDPNSPYSGVISIFTERAKKGENLVIYGDGNQTRDFIPAERVAELAIKLMGNSGTFNIGTGKPTKINELAERIIKENKSNSEITHAPERDGDIRDSWADIEKLKRFS